MAVSFNEDLRKQAAGGETLLVLGLLTTSKEGKKALQGSKGVDIEEVLLPKNSAKILKYVRDVIDEDQAEREELKKTKAAEPVTPAAKSEPTPEPTPPAAEAEKAPAAPAGHKPPFSKGGQPK